MSWDGSTAAAARPSRLESVIWSPCDRFIAITCYGAGPVDVLDSVTLQRLQTLEFPQAISMRGRVLIFSPDSRILTCSGGRNGQGDGLFVVSWDLQTGGVASVIRWRAPGRSKTGTPSVTYSVNGKTVGVFYSIDDRSSKYSAFFICDVVSGVLMHSHPLDNTVLPKDHIWIYGESLRFATAGATTITIWEVQFTSGATPTEVETLPAPDGFSGGFHRFRVLPDPSRLVFAYLDSDRRILVWDTRNSRYLLECGDAEFCLWMSFSSNGRFFACSTTGSGTYVWKESPDGYILHRILASGGLPLPAGNGESVVTRSDCAIQLWRTRSFATTHSSILAEGPRYLNGFTVEFSPGERLAVVAKMDNTVTVLNLKSGVPQLTIDASMRVYGLGVNGNTAVIIGYPKVIAWDLPAGDCVSHARVGLECSSWTINLGDSRSNAVAGASISPDFRYIALIMWEAHPDTVRTVLHIYNASTGEHLGKKPIWVETHRFSPGGRDVWCIDHIGQVEVWRVGDGQEVLECLVSRIDMEDQQEGNPWGSSRGYRVTNDWWILGPDGKRLLMLPPPWQSYAGRRVWKGLFLALLHDGLSEPVTLEFEVNRDL